LLNLNKNCWEYAKERELGGNRNLDSQQNHSSKGDLSKADHNLYLSNRRSDNDSRCNKLQKPAWHYIQMKTYLFREIKREI
jgi:hypothetical protein